VQHLALAPLMGSGIVRCRCIGFCAFHIKFCVPIFVPEALFSL
jgi:hypothetical protein